MEIDREIGGESERYTREKKKARRDRSAVSNVLCLQSQLIRQQPNSVKIYFILWTSNSKPLIIAEETSGDGMLCNFLPVYLSVNISSLKINWFLVTMLSRSYSVAVWPCPPGLPAPWPLYERP